MIDIDKYLKEKYGNNPIENQYYHVPNVYLNKVIVPIFNEFIYNVKGRKPGYVSESLSRTKKWYIIQPIYSPISESTLVIGNYDVLEDAALRIIKEISNLRRKLDYCSDFKFRYKRYFFIYKEDIEEMKQQFFQQLKKGRNNHNKEDWEILYHWLRYPTFPVYIKDINSKGQMENLEVLSKIIREK